MGSVSEPPVSDMHAVVTGANRGIGLAITRQLAERGVTVVLTARNEKRGTDALQSLRQAFGLSNIIFHQLDVQDPVSIANLVEFITAQFGKLDILVNNAGAPGASVDIEDLKALNIDAESWLRHWMLENFVYDPRTLSGKVANIVQGFIRQTHDDAVTCFGTNYFRCKRVTEALPPLLHLSTSGAMIVNLSSLRGELKRSPNERTRGELDNIDNLNEETIEKILDRFLENMRDGTVEAGGWPTIVPIYSISKAALNAYTRVLANRHRKMYRNCVHPGYVKTDLNFNTGIISTEEGAKAPVMLDLLPDNGHSGCYFDQTNIAEY